MTRIAIKVYYPGNDIRRVTLKNEDFSLSRLREVVALEGHESQHVVLKYKDNEGDWVVIGSDDELHDVESFKDTSDSILRLQYSYHVQGSAAPHSAEKPEEIKIDLGEIFQGFLGAFKPAFQPPQGEHRPWFGRRGHGCPFKRGPCPQPAEGEHQQHPRCGRGWRRDPKAHLARKMAWVENLIKTEHYAAAEHMLHRMSYRHPAEPNVHYNLACVYALTDRKTEAVRALEKAVSLGYKDFDWMRRDEDLVSLHDLPEFQAIVASGEGNEKPVSQQNSDLEAAAEELMAETETLVKEQPVDLHPQVEEKVELKVENPQQTKFAVELALLNDMGFSDMEHNLALLTRFNGDVSAVAQELLLN